MQEPAAAKEADKRRRQENIRQSRLAELSRYRSKNPTIDATDGSSSPQEIDDEGGGGGARYHGRGGEEEEEEQEKPKEEGKGDVMDYEA